MRLSIQDIQTPLHMRAKIYLNGVKQSHCTYACEETGIIKRFILDESGKPFISNNELATETVNGEVKIIDPENPEE